MKQKDIIIQKVLEILEQNPQGIRYSQLVRAVKAALPEVPENTIHGTVWDLHKQNLDIIKPDRGVFMLKKFLTESFDKKLNEIETRLEKTLSKEELFYKPFADYLENDLGECTKAISLGGSKFKDKWGTPDVIGIYKFSEADPIRPTHEIVSAEIKTAVDQLITAFGQACSYKLFSDKVYLAVPKDSPGLDRVEALCNKFGIGLIIFNRKDAINPNFEIRTRAIKSAPDYFYVNESLKLLGDDLKKLL